jgi:thioredoxin 1
MNIKKGRIIMLKTNLTHIITQKDHSELINSNENVMVCCGRMGPMCIPVYEVMEELESEYKNVKFADMEFDSPEAAVIRNLRETSSFQGLPFTVYYKSGKVVKATTSIQSREQITEILDENFVK